MGSSVRDSTSKMCALWILRTKKMSYCCIEFCEITKLPEYLCYVYRNWFILLFCFTFVKTGQMLHSVHEHNKQINDIMYSKNMTMLITASKDTTAKVRPIVPLYRSTGFLTTVAIGFRQIHVYWFTNVNTFISHC